MRTIYTLIYAIMHFIVDGICAMALYGWLTKFAFEHWLFLAFYFCAYVLQLPFGIMADHMIKDKEKIEADACLARLCWLGILLIVAGACSTPILMGVGSALFHVGSLGGTILEDKNHGWSGICLGLYLAPGLAGDYLGQQYTQMNPVKKAQILFIVACGVLLAGMILFEVIFQFKKKRGLTVERKKEPALVEMVRLPEKKKWDVIVCACCFLTAASHFSLGETMEFSWTSGIMLGALGAGAVMIGKLAGSIVNAKFGSSPTIFISMLAASVLFCMGNFPITGLLAFAAYNMLVPVIVYIMEEQFPTLPGFITGTMGCAVFLGYIPEWLNLNYTIFGIKIAHSLIGSVSSMSFLALLLIAAWLAERD